MLKPLLDSLLDVLFPPRCHACRTYIPHAGDVHICPTCREQLAPILSPLCVGCGVPFAGAGGDHTCGHCLLHRPHFDTARAAFVYDGPCRDLIHAFKYRYKTHLRRPLARMTAGCCSGFIVAAQPDLIMPVPLHRARMRSRGFNQAVLLGEVFSRITRLPLDRDTLKRVRWTEPQVNLSVEDRRSNVKGAFSVGKPERVAGRSILLVDDVLTTGSTVDECSRVLKAAGAAKVAVLTVARALPH